MKFVERVDWACGFSSRTACTAVAAALAGALWLSPAVAAQAAAPVAAFHSTDSQLRDAWRQAISRKAVPREGCFAAAYPVLAWAEVACTTAPPRRYEPAHGVSGFTVGNGNDYAAVVTGLMTSSVGTFPSISGLKSESDGGVASEYSLQLNSQFFASPACSGAATPSSCLGWQQFVFAEDAGGEAFMQYWLIGYGSKCPKGWMAFDKDCYRNSNAIFVPAQTIKQLGNLSLTGKANALGLDTITLTTPDHAYSVTGRDTVVTLAKFWNASEFNVIGDGNGSEAKFNKGTSISVKIVVHDGKTAAPTCAAHAGTTAETNNLTLGSCTTTGGSAPSVEFTE